MEYPQVLNRFINDIRDHQLTVLRDDGLYRHLSFGRPGSNSYRFDLVTWPGYLCVTGDCGTWTFSRIPDMFDFFSMKNTAVINPGYWAEKICAGAGGGRSEFCYDFDEQAYIKMLSEWFSEYFDDNSRNKSNDAEVSQKYLELKELSFSSANEALMAINDYDLPGFDVFCAPDLKMFSFHYLWICYAIVHGIGRYNQYQLAQKAMTTFLAVQYVAPQKPAAKCNCTACRAARMLFCEESVNG